MKLFDSLCTPAQVYVLLAALSIILLLAQNVQSPNRYTVGRYSVPLQHNNMVFFIFKILYVVVWTFILNKLCRAGYKRISWFLVLLPFLLFFVLIALLLLANM